MHSRSETHIGRPSIEHNRSVRTTLEEVLATLTKMHDQLERLEGIVGGPLPAPTTAKELVPALSLESSAELARDLAQTALARLGALCDRLG